MSCIAKSVSPNHKSLTGSDRSIDLVLSNEYKGGAPTVLRSIWPGPPLERGKSVFTTIEGESKRIVAEARSTRVRIEYSDRETGTGPLPCRRQVHRWLGPRDVWLRYIDSAARHRTGGTRRSQLQYGTRSGGGGNGRGQTGATANIQFRESAFVSDRHPHPRRSPDAGSAVLTASSRLGYNSSSVISDLGLEKATTLHDLAQ